MQHIMHMRLPIHHISSIETKPVSRLVSEIFGFKIFLRYDVTADVTRPG